MTSLRDNKVIWSGKVTGYVEGSDEVDPEGWSADTRANSSLKEANTNLIKKLKMIGTSTPPLDDKDQFTFNGK
ncbi:hypothetical protein [Pelotalea chapellei]|uniref:Uncharacterized protein n=1 Tax=Pelotalea chapellei TaxID=44671 RepID=A0ABS5UB86_9BACT|nr:hypothetical protein [Pelotalea chapellei]MBT1072950.1 hypothetical protein [Pelotalea chapellei]